MSRYMRVQPINLGAVASISGGTGIPPGGIIGYLPQTRVAYDISETALSGFVNDDYINASGVIVNASLLDNLNHIRYRLDQLEESGGGLLKLTVYDNGVMVASGVSVLDFDDGLKAYQDGSNIIITASGLTIQDNDVTTASGVTILNFEGNSTVVKNEAGKVTVTVTTSGGSGLDEKVKISANDTTEDYLENKVVGASGKISLSTLNDGSNEDLEIDIGSDVFDKTVDTLDDITDGTSYEKVAAGELSAGIYKNATYTVKGIASFNGTDFTVSAGAVSIYDPGIDHDSLLNFLSSEHFTKVLQKIVFYSQI